jgi:GMP synthase (glutamine-hydrolysing)
MKIGILETGLINEKLIDRYDPYPVMFAALLDRAQQDLQYQTYSVIRREMPASIHDCEGWLITGSRHGVYESLDWMLKLQVFIRELERASVPLVGICFGHQIIAQALGGEVVKSDKGWSVGLHSYQIDVAQAWMGDAPEQVGIYTFHQDQVVEKPPAAKVFSSSDFCPYAGLGYGDSIITIQAHPEFEEGYELALLNLYGDNIVPGPVASKALADMQASGRKADTQMLAGWLTRFMVAVKYGQN